MNLVEKLKKMPIRRFDFDYDWYKENKNSGFRMARRIFVQKFHPKCREGLISCSSLGIMSLNYYSEGRGRKIIHNSGRNKKNGLAFEDNVFLRQSLAFDLKLIDYRLKPFGLRLFILSGYRDIRLQRLAIEGLSKQKRRKNARPVTELLSNPENYSPHTTGGAIDCEIWDEKKKKLLLTKLDDREKIDLFWLEDKKNLSQKEEEVKLNRRLLHNILVSEEILGQNHFIHHPSEYWHYGRHERLASFFSGGGHPAYYDVLNLD